MNTESKLPASEIHKKRVKLWDESIAGHDRYKDDSTGFLANEFVEKRNCPACGGKEASHAEMFVKSGGRYVRCKNCTMVFLNPVLTDKHLNEYYSNNHVVQSEIVQEDIDFYRSIYEEGLDLFLRHNGQCVKVLDYGCSAGDFLDIAKENLSANTYGVELNKSEALKAKEKGHKVFSSLKEVDADGGGDFDLVTLWDVFEHLKDGMGFLTEVRDFLKKKKGLVLLQIPNVSSLAARVMRERCNMFDGLEHVNLYNMESLQALCERSGYRVVDARTVISEINVLANYLNYEDPYLGERPATDQLLGVLDAETIHRNLLGYKLQVLLEMK